MTVLCRFCDLFARWSAATRRRFVGVQDDLEYIQASALTADGD